MCGFVGVVAFDQKLAIGRSILERMSARIAHRGPDGEGMWISPNGNISLAHRRMAVLDPEPRSNQPFTDGRRWLVYNGEIYNFRELRRQIDQEFGPRPWRTTGDTEVLLEAYGVWGEKCVDHLNGMFAFAVWDEMADSVFMARDRMGQKPLYIAAQPGAIGFASEIGPLLCVPWVDRAIDMTAVGEYLRWGYISSPQTVYANIKQLLPGQTQLVNAQSNTSQFFLQSMRETKISVAEETRELVQQAVSRQLVSDVPLGCFLSGGIDSSVIAAAAVRALPKDQRLLTFSIGFDDPRYDETQYAAAVAKYLNTQHQAFTVRPDAIGDLPKIAAAFGQPMGDSSALATHYLSLQTRRYVKVALSGDGGDELFGGYDRYRAMRIVQSTGKWPWAILSPLIWRLPGSHPKSMIARLKRLAESSQLPEAQRYAAYMRLMDERLLEQLMPGLARGGDYVERAFEQARRDHGLLEAAMATDRQTYLPEDVLTKVDRCSMLHALEVRSPFMDHNLVKFAAGLTASQLFGGRPKRLLREAFLRDLPGWVFRRRKMGFAVPVGQWLRESLRPMLHDLLFAGDSFAAAYFQRPVLEKMIREHQEQKQDHSQRLYALLMLELWWKTNGARL